MGTAKPIVYVVDDDAASRSSLVYLIDSIGVETQAFADPMTFLDAFDAARPACVVLDVRMPRISGIEVIRKLRARGSAVPAIVVTAFGEISTAVEAMKTGAYDFMEKPVSDQILIENIQQCLRDHERLLDRERHLDEAVARFRALTNRELQVLDHLARGMRNKQIAHALQISIKTVEEYRINLMRKTGVTSLAQLIALNTEREFRTQSGRPLVHH